MLANAAEEMSLVVADEVERRSNGEERSKTRNGNSLRPWTPLLSVAQVEALFKDLFGDTPTAHAHYAQLVDQALVAMRAGQSVGALANAAQADVTKRLMFLLALARKAEEAGDYELATEVLDEALRLEAEHRQGILAGVNTAAAAKNFGKGDLYRKAYREGLLAAQSLRGMIRKVLEIFGEEDFERGVPLLLRGLGEDLASVHPSSEPEKLRILLGDAFLLQTTATVFGDCRGLCERLAVRYAATVSPLATMDQLLDITSQPFTAEFACDNFLNSLGTTDPGAFIESLRGVRQLAAALPDRVWIEGDPDPRQMCLEAIEVVLFKFCEPANGRPFA